MTNEKERITRSRRVGTTELGNQKRSHTSTRITPVYRIRVAPVNRSIEIVERLAEVPKGTHARFQIEVAKITNSNYQFFLPENMEIAIQERFNEIRAIPELRRYHDIASNWFGKPTSKTLEVFSEWGFLKGEEVVPNIVRNKKEVSNLIKTQDITLPRGIELKELGGLICEDQVIIKITSLVKPKNTSKK